MSLTEMTDEQRREAMRRWADEAVTKGAEFLDNDESGIVRSDWRKFMRPEDLAMSSGTYCALAWATGTTYYNGLDLLFPNSADMPDGWPIDHGFAASDDLDSPVGWDILQDRWYEEAR